MEFLNPLWLVAAGSIALPVMIHLWALRPGKTIQIGSIAFFGQERIHSKKALNFFDLPLLIIRCAIFLTLSLLLAQPLIRPRGEAYRAKGWILIPKESIATLYSILHRPIDSLLRLGMELHSLDTAFELLNSKDWANIKDWNNSKDGAKNASVNPNSRVLPPTEGVKLSRSAQIKDFHSLPDAMTGDGNSTVGQPLNYWDLIRRLNSRLPPKFPVFWYGASTLSHFKGKKPASNLSLHWITPNFSRATRQWIEQGWRATNGMPNQLVGECTPFSLSYRIEEVIAPEANKFRSERVPENGHQGLTDLAVAPNGTKKKEIAIDTGIFNLGLVVGTREQDGAYLKAALESVCPYLPCRCQIDVYHTSRELVKKHDWIFWLSDEAIPPAVVRRTSHLLEYQQGGPIGVNSWVEGPSSKALMSIRAPIGLFQKVNGQDLRDEPIWVDGFGNTLLGQAGSPGHSLFRFYTRFNPAWSELVWSRQFPPMLLSLIQQASFPERPIQEARELEKSQQIPVLYTGGLPPTTPLGAGLRLDGLLWIFAFFLFLAERVVTYLKDLKRYG